MHLYASAINNTIGFSTYERGIISRLATQYDDIDVDAYQFCGFRGKYDVTRPQFIRFKQVRLPGYLVWNHAAEGFRKIIKLFFRLISPFISLNLFTGDSSNDVYLFFENAVPHMNVKGKVAVILHDIIPLKVAPDPSRIAPDILNELAVRRCSDEFANIMKRAVKIITVSKFSRKDIADCSHMDEDKIDVVYNAVDTSAFSSEYDLDTMRRKYGLPEKYILYFGDCNMRKNVEEVIRAYALLPEALREEYKLVITNPVQDTIACSNRSGVSKDVVYLYRVPEEDKPGIYQMASLFVWLSVYEGFGLPIVEAMAAGVPVICSNATSHPEVAGDAAILVGPHDTKQIASEIERVLTDENLRKELVAKGYENIKRFSWDESAKKLHDIIINL